MMLKHIEDKGDLRIFINSEGGLLARCDVCGMHWVGSITPQETGSALAGAPEGEWAIEPADPQERVAEQKDLGRVKSGLNAIREQAAEAFPDYFGN